LQLSQKVAKIERVNIEDLVLDFTIPGYDIELRVRAVKFLLENNTNLFASLTGETYW
jgi:E3 ubiquitin-protein ligase TRIP12